MGTARAKDFERKARLYEERTWEDGTTLPNETRQTLLLRIALGTGVLDFAACKLEGDLVDALT